MRFNKTSALAGAFIAGVAAKPVLFGYAEFSNKTAFDTLDFAKYTHINLAFALPQPDGSIQMAGGGDDDFVRDSAKTLPETVDKIHQKGAKALVSLGGWKGSANFSSLVKDEALGQTFTDNIVDLVKANKLDGIDIDWEYPGQAGDACNVFDKDADTANYQKFLEKLRERLDSEFKDDDRKLITMAVYVAPFMGPDGPSKDVSGIANSVDFAFVMAYDLTGPWANTTGANAPLDAPEGGRSFTTAMQAWLDARWPAEKLVAGIPFYGHSMQMAPETPDDVSELGQPTVKTVPKGDVDDVPGFDKCANKMEDLSGAWRWKNMMGEKLLAGAAEANEPWVRHVDDRSKTPWLFNKETKVFLTYDDPDSIKAKVEAAKAKNMAGTMVWAINFDTDDYALTNAINDNWQ